MSHTLTGLGEAGRGSSLSEQLLQKISPQLRQWCWRQTSVPLRGCSKTNWDWGEGGGEGSTHLPSGDGELLLTQLAVAGVLVLQPHLTSLEQPTRVKLPRQHRKGHLHPT